MTLGFLYAIAVLAGGGILLLLLGRRLPARWSAWAALGPAAVALVLVLVFRTGPSEVALFRWLPAGLEVSAVYRFDALAATMALMAAVPAGLLLLWMALGAPMREGPFAPWVLLLLALFLHLLGSADPVLTYAAWEMLILATYLLLIYRRPALPTPGIAEWFLGVQHLAGYPLLFAVLLSGTPPATAAPGGQGTGAPVLAAALLVLLTAWVRTAQVPFHLWALAAAEAPGPISTLLLGSWGLLAGPYLWMRFLAPLEGSLPQEVAMAAGSASLLVGAVLALRQAGARQVQAGATVSQLGLLWLALGLGGPWGPAAAWFLGLDFLLGKVLFHLALSDAGGLKRPVRQGLYALGMWGAAGLPPSLGFVARYVLALGLMQAGRAYYLPLLLLATPLALAYLWRGWNLVPLEAERETWLAEAAQRGLGALLALLPLAGLAAPPLWGLLLEPATRAVLGRTGGDLSPVLMDLFSWLLPAVVVLLLFGAGVLAWSGTLRPRRKATATAAVSRSPLQEVLPVLSLETAWLAWIGQLSPLYRLLGRLGEAVVLATRSTVTFLERHTIYFLLAVMAVAAAVLIVLTR